MAFTHDIPIRFADCDAARIVYHPRYLHFCHVTMEELFARRVGVPYARALQEEDVGYPAVRVEGEYVATVPMGETLRMRAVVERVGGRSVDFRYEGWRASDDVLAFTIRMRCVATSMACWQSRDMPPHHRAAFEALTA